MPGLESCDAIDPRFWDEDGRHVVAQLSERCGVENSPIISHDAVRSGAWTQRQYEDLWKRLECTFVRRSGVECGELWSVAFTCRCERGGRERVFGQVANCSFRKGRLVCRTDCRREGCAHGAILPALAPSDLPKDYVTPQPVLPYESGAVTEILVRTRTGAGTVSTSNEYRFARLDPAECKKVIGAPTVMKRDDAYAGCLSRLAEITDDPAVCRHLRTYEDGAHLPRCASSLARSRGDLRACFEISRPTDLWRDLGVSAEPSFSRCVAEGIREHPSADGCELLERTIDADMDPADRCYDRLAVQERDPAWCTRIVHPRRADGCLSGMASELPDAALCDRLGDPERRRTCRERAARGPGVPERPQPQTTRLDPPRAPPASPVTPPPAGGAAREPERSTPPSAPLRSAPEPKPVFFVRDTFVDDVALDPSSSPLSCRPALFRHVLDTLNALGEQARRRGAASDPRSIVGDELRALLSRIPGCRELDPRLTYWGLFVDGHGAAWRKVDASPTLELAAVPLECGGDVMESLVQLRISPSDALLIAGLPDRGRAGAALYQHLAPEAAVSAASAPGTQRILLATPRLGGIRKAFVEKRVVSWTAEDSDATAELVVEKATLVLERDAGGKQARVEAFRDEGFGKYLYSHADIRDVRLLDADFDGDVDVLLSTGNGGRYLVLFERDRPHGEPVRLRRPRAVRGC